MESGGPTSLMHCEEAIQDELDKGLTQKEVAKTYSLAMISMWPTDWGLVNRAIIKRWSKSGLQRIKVMAFTGKCWDRERETHPNP